MKKTLVIFLAAITVVIVVAGVATTWGLIYSADVGSPNNDTLNPSTVSTFSTSFSSEVSKSTSFSSTYSPVSTISTSTSSTISTIETSSLSSVSTLSTSSESSSGSISESTTLKMDEVYSTVLIISGGRTTMMAPEQSVEVFPVPEGYSSCAIPNLPSIFANGGHSVNGLIACIGSECQKLEVTGWKSFKGISPERKHHVSWETQDGIYLIGGEADPKSVTFVSKDITQNNVDNPFTLEQNSLRSCLIDDGDTFILTGGYNPDMNQEKDVVSRYNENGLLEILPSLKQGRFDHGCGSYIDSSNKKVFIVAGGGNGDLMQNSFLDITEIYTGSEWIHTNALPSATTRLRAQTHNNELFMFGGRTDTNQFLGDIIFYDDDFQTWEQDSSQMQKQRENHALSKIKVEDIEQFCV